MARAKALRYSLQREAATLLYDPNVEPRGQHRTCWCNRTLFGNAVTAQRSESGGVRFMGVMVCDQPWTCPVCCVKISQKRSADLKAAVEGWVMARPGNLVYLVTYTFPHESDQALAELLTRFYAARQRFANCRTFKRVRADHDSPGVVRSTEVTVGQANGWHPHLHELLFVHRPLTVEECDQLRSEWIRILMKVGLGTQAQISDMWDRALDIRGGEAAAEYIAKFGREERWGASAELTRRHAKQGSTSAKSETFKPFALLAMSLDGNEWAGARFREYAEAFKGKRLLTWSPGLRDSIGLPDELPDDQVPDEPSYVDSAKVQREDWQILLSRAAVPMFVEIVSLEADPERAQLQIDDLVARCRGAPVVKRGDVMSRGLFGFAVINQPVTWQ